MTTDRSKSPPPKGAGKATIIIAVVFVAIIATVFVGMNAQHTADQKDQQTGQVKPKDLPMTEKDLGKLPAPPRQ